MDEAKIPAESLIQTGLLLLVTVGLTMLFWHQYALYRNPVHTHASITKLEAEGMTYKFYVPSENKTLYFKRNLLLNEAQKLQSVQQLEVVYPASMPDYVVIPSLERPLPVWLYMGVHFLVLLAFLQSIKTLQSSFHRYRPRP